MITVRAPILSARQEALWRATIAFGTRLPADAWTVVGGQMCHLHAWERGGAIPRPTSDLDAGLNARDHPRVGVDATQRLKDAGFEPVRTSVDGPQVRWSRDGLVIDVVLPAGLARRDDRRRKLDVDGRVMLESHGVQQALGRSESITLMLPSGTAGVIRRPSLVGSIVAKAAALSHQGDCPERHLDDLVVLLPLLKQRDIEDAEFTSRDREHLTLAARPLSDERRRWSSTAVIEALQKLDVASRR